MPSDREVVITRTLNAPRALVFEAWTTPKHVTQWMLGPEGWTMPVCEIDLRSGGTWRFVWRKEDGQEMEMTGAYLEVDPPERIVSSECWGADWPQTTNTLTFTEDAGRTTVSIAILYPDQTSRDAALQTGMDSGMEQSYERLEALLETLQNRERS